MGKVCHVDLDAGDTMSTSLLGTSCDDTWDVTYVRVRNS